MELHRFRHLYLQNYLKFLKGERPHVGIILEYNLGGLTSYVSGAFINTEGILSNFFSLSTLNLCLRSQAQSISTFVMWISNCIVGAAYSPINEAIGGSIFFLFGAFNVIAIIFVFFCFPETKNKKPAEIQKFFHSKSRNFENIVKMQHVLLGLQNIVYE